MLEQEIQREADAFEPEAVPTDEPPELAPEQRQALEAGTLPQGVDSSAFLFETADSTRVPLSQIQPIRARPEGIANARPLMARAALGGSRREPLSVRQEADGTYTLLDGNSTFAVLQEAGAEDVPVRVLTDEEFETDQVVAAVRKVLKSPGKKPRYIEAPLLPRRQVKSAWEMLRQPRKR